jgi:Asp-tRNA(Asn)/Glu-tRNA(Gln) amidotransferase A subunit family amidase
MSSSQSSFIKHENSSKFRPKTGFLYLILSTAMLPQMAYGQTSSGGFSVVESTIGSMHEAIKAGKVTCAQVVQQYIDRSKAYNGVCTALVTKDGADIASVKGYVRNGTPISFPTKTVAASKIFPKLADYNGLPLDYGRMERTMSNPEAFAQMGMRVGIPDAGQVNALETFNIRGERSQTCRGSFDAHPSSGPLPANAPSVCEEFRKQPDALERAAELDRLYGTNPPLASMPMYCVAAALKDPYETKDMRSTANSDVAFAMDAPPNDSPVTDRLRKQGAIIFAKTSAHEFNAGPNNPGGPFTPITNMVNGGQAISSWSGQACNPYDTERVPRGSSSGVGVAISANLAMIGICEQTAASCQGPASRNGNALLLPSQGLLPGTGGIGNSTFIDRPGIITRTLGDAALVLSAIKDPEKGYYYPGQPYALPKSLIPAQAYSSFTLTKADLQKSSKPLSGMTIAILREHMKHENANHVAISNKINDEIINVLMKQLGAKLIEVPFPGAPDDPDIPNAKFSFADGLARVMPTLMPEFFARQGADGKPIFDVKGWDVKSPQYLRALLKGDAPMPGNVTLTNYVNYGVLPCPNCGEFVVNINEYLAARGDSKIKDWESWVANAKFRQDLSRAAALNWATIGSTAKITAEGNADKLLRSYVGRLALQMMMAENGIDLFVHAENTMPTPKIQGPSVGAISLEGITPFLQIPRIVVPAGMNDVVVEPEFVLNKDKTDYVSVVPEGAKQSKMAHPMPIAITFFANQGDEPLLIKVGSAYEAATGHRTPPPSFGQLR